MASQAYRQYIIGIGEIQIDGGVDGIFFDEVSGSYEGATYNGNEGFDDADVADFGGFLCAKYPNLTAAQFETEVCNQLTSLFNCAQVIVELEPLPPGTANLAGLLPQFNASGQLQSTPPVDVGRTPARRERTCC